MFYTEGERMHRLLTSCSLLLLGAGQREEGSATALRKCEIEWTPICLLTVRTERWGEIGNKRGLGLQRAIRNRDLISPKKTCRWPIDTCKDAQHC